MSDALPPAPAGRRNKRAITGGIFLLVGILIGRYLLPLEPAASPVWQWSNLTKENRQLVFPTFWEAWDQLHANFLTNLDDRNLFYGAISGMVQASGDPYTVFSDPEETKQFEQTLRGHFSGIGVEIGLKNGLVTVIAPLAGSPADAAGVLEGDIIVAVDDEALTADMALDDVVQRIRGPLGEPVKLTIVRQGSQETQDISIVRNTITIESVKMTIADGIAHITISSFNGDTVEQFTKLAQQAATSNLTGIILDVRGNPGGFLQSAVDIASFFLDPGTLVVSEKGRQETQYKARGGPILRQIPTVMLVNEGSASASEILAGALQDQLDIKIVGSKTFGKGSVQELIGLKDGSSLRVTVAKWFTPDGRSINDEGIQPDISIESDRQTDNDEQLERARQELTGS